MACVTDVQPLLAVGCTEESTPAQQHMCGTEGAKGPTGPGWDIPADADPFFRNGIDWAKWEQEATPPTVYHPPQFRPGYVPCTWINWWQQRSPLLQSPCVPCGCSLAPCCYKCCVRGVDYLPFAQPDEWMVKMLSTGASPKCPEFLKGIWWMSDNIAAHEHLITFHDADWATDNLALKVLAHNWTRGPTAFGAGLFWFTQANGNKLRIEVSPNKKWISIAGKSGNPTWMYITGSDSGDHFKLDDGSDMQMDPVEIMRLSFTNDADCKSAVTYQYRVRRIAYIDAQGKLVKTPAYDELLKRATMPLPYEPCCCGFGWNLTAEQAALGNFPQLPSHTVIKYAPPAPGSASGTV